MSVKLFPTLPHLTLTGIIDIVLVAFIVYQALMVVRGTRAGHILMGILTIVTLYAVALWARLEALRSLLAYIVPYIGLAVIVLFQSEIRRTLARIGRKRWFGRGFRRPEAIDDVLMALGRLAADKTGALVVLERDIGLRTFVESGVRMDSQLTRDLLLTIFYPGTAMHDGAVIVQKNKIAAAACFLPLTTNPAVSQMLGTRHRAAIGITEETDCLSLVVSEETGRLSVAAFGEIAQGLTLKEVDERINSHFGVQRVEPARTGESASGVPPADGSPGPPQPAEKVNQP
jgi:diadenylate cyclase